MTDSEWLSYFTSHCRTPRAGFVKSNIEKLFELAGDPVPDGLVEGRIYSLYEDFIDPLVAKARARMEDKPHG